MNYPSTFELPTSDLLTGLLTQPYFRHVLREELLPAAERTGDPLALFLLDLDGFVRPHQEIGKECGDEILQAVAQTLREAAPDSAVVCRYGGDEFVVALPDMRLDDAFSLAEDVRRAIAALHYPHCPDVRLTCSIGLASYPAQGRTDVELMREADQALYRSKVTGPNKVSLPLADSRMITKTSHYTATQLERLAGLARAVNRNEASLLREALDDLLKKYDDQPETLPPGSA